MLYEKAREIHAERFPYNDFLYQKYDQDQLISDGTETPDGGE